MLDLYCILGEHVYQISDLHQVHWFQKIEFGEVVVVRDLVKICPKFGKTSKNVNFSEAMMPLVWF